MGLDWCLRSKRRSGTDDTVVEAAEKLAEQLAEQDETLWAAYLEEHNKGERPSEYPNALADAFNALPETKLRRKGLKEAKETVASYYISTMEELGVPRVGIDEEATEWARKNFEAIPETRWRDGKPSVATYLEANYGKYVPDLARIKDGLGKCTGLLAGADSFRGKIVGYAQDIVGADLAEEAYKDMEPDQLLDYGNRLLDAAKKYLHDAGQSEIIDAPSEQVKELLKEEANRENLWNAWYCVEGAKWCIFWGSRGFSMHAWY